MPNYNPETKIPYGVVSLNSLAEWVYEEFFNYGENTSYADALEEWKKTNPDGEEEDFSDEYESQEDCYSLETDKMSLGLSYLGGAAMVWVFKSDHTTLASPCSPCVPGAGDLDSQHEQGIRCYTLPNDWFAEPMMANTQLALEIMQEVAKPNTVGEWLAKKRKERGLT